MWTKDEAGWTEAGGWPVWEEKQGASKPYFHHRSLNSFFLLELVAKGLRGNIIIPIF